MSNQTDTLLKLASMYGHDVKMVANTLLSLPEFELWSGASKSHQHHYGKGGLAQHTMEVVELCLLNKNWFRESYQIDEVELYFAALYHDAGKIYDFRPMDAEYKSWGSSDHKRLVHHLPRSAIMWSQAITPYGYLARSYHDNVLHAILAHHGNREAGSPVSPKSRVAWLVHFCDGISARMYDADTLDVVRET